MKGKMRQDLYRELYTVEDTHWWHQQKRNLVHAMIAKYASKGSVLDIGAGTGKILEELKTHGWKVYGVDGEADAVQWCRERGIAIDKHDVEKSKLPYKDGSFDLVLTLDILEHLEKPEKVVKEVTRVLKRGGIFIITVPAYNRLYSYWDEMLGHQRRYEKEDVRLLVKDGFKLQFLSSYMMLPLIPSVLVRFVKEKITKQTVESDFNTLPLQPISEPLLRWYCKGEEKVLNSVPLPFGLSVIAVAQKL